MALCLSGERLFFQPSIEHEVAFRIEADVVAGDFVLLGFSPSELARIEGESQRLQDPAKAPAGSRTRCCEATGVRLADGRRARSLNPRRDADHSYKGDLSC